MGDEEKKESTLEVLLDDIEASTPEVGSRASRGLPAPPRSPSLPPPPPPGRTRTSAPPPIPSISDTRSVPPPPPPSARRPPAKTESTPPPLPPTPTAAEIRVPDMEARPSSMPPPPPSHPSVPAPSASMPPPPPEAPPVARPPAQRTQAAGPPPLPSTTVELETSHEVIDSAKQLISECELELAQTTDDRRAAQLHFEIGRLQEWPVGDHRNASLHFEEARKRMPQSIPILQGARRTLVLRRNFAAALSLFDDEIRLAPDPRQKASLLLEKGQLLSGVLARKDEGHAAFLSALELDRTNGAVIRAMIDRTLELGKPAELESLLERASNHASGDASHRAALVVRRAQLVERELNEPERAIELFETALKLDAKAPGALAALKRLHHSSRRWRDLIRVLSLEAELTEDEAVRTAALFRVAKLHSERLGNRNEALAALESAIRTAPDDPEILSELARHYTISARWDALSDTLQRLVRTIKDPRERMGVLHRIGAIEEQRLGHIEPAVHWYEAALAIDAAHRPTLQALGPLYSRLERWEALMAMHQAEAHACKDSPRRAACFVRVATILENLGRHDEAIEHHEKALAVVPGDPSAFKALVRLLAEARRHRDLIELYERAVAETRRVEHRVAHLVKIGGIHEELLSEPQQASQAYRRILDVQPKNLSAIHALQRSSERAGDAAQLLDALDREIALTTDAIDRVPLVHRAGEVLEHQMDDAHGAIRRHREVLDLDETFQPSLASLGRLYHAAGRWDDLLDVYERELRLAPDPEDAVSLLQRAGEVCRERLGRDEDARTYFRRALELDPTHGPAQRALVESMETKGDWKALLEVHRAALKATREPRARAQIQYRIGQICEERVSDPAGAIRAYSAALEASPRHRPAIDGLLRVRTHEGAWTAMAQDLGREREAAADPRLGVDALLREGELWSHQLREPKRAIACFEGVLEHDPAHLGALLALEELFLRIGRTDALVRIYASQAMVFMDASSRISALHAQARVMESRDSDTAAVAAVHRAILDLDPADARALRALELLATQTGDPRDIADAERRLSTSTQSIGSRAAHLTRLGESLEALGESGALDSFRRALELDPKSLGATRGLSRVATRVDDPTVLAEAARQEASIARDGRAASDLLVRSARVRAERLGDIPGATDDLIRALELAPSSRVAADSLSSLMRQQGEPARLAELLGRAAGAADAERSPELWLEVASIHADDLGRLTAAIGALTRVLRTAPTHVPTLWRVAEYYHRDEQWNEAVAAIGRVVQLTREGDVLLAAHLRLAELWDEKLGDAQRALVSLQAVLSIDGGNAEALMRLTEIHEREGRLDDAAEASKRLLLTETGDGPRRAQALVQLARVERARGHDAAAADALREAVALEGPGSESALECKALTTTTAAWDQYLSALEQFLQRLENDSSRAPVYLEMGRVLFDQLERPNQGIEVLELGARTCDEPQLERELAHRLRTSGQTDRALEVLEGLFHGEPSRAETWRELGRTYEDAGRASEARVATEPLLILGQATEQDHRRIDAAPARPAQAKEGSLHAELLDRLGSPSSEQRIASELLRTLEPALAKLYPPEFESYNLSSRDRLSTRGTVHPLRQLADELSAILGAPPVDIYLHEVRSRGLSLEFASPMAIVVPAAVLDLPESQQVFLLARPLVHITRQFPAVGKLTPRELEVLLASASRNVQERFGAGLTAEDFLEEQAKRIYKATPRRQRKALEEAARTYVSAPRVDFARWANAAVRTANRAAALLSDDLSGAIEVLRRTEREMTGIKAINLVHESDVARDLMTFWPSSAAMHLRRHIGLVS